MPPLTPHTPAPAHRLIVALDVPSPDAARALAHALAPAVRVFKIGVELIYAGGLPLVGELTEAGAQVFLDAKLLDIGATVERAVASAARSGATFLTVHATDRKTLAAAMRGRGAGALKLLAVTVLTNLDRHDLSEQGIGLSPDELVLHRALLAREAGFAGVVASGREAGALRAALGPDMLIVTPGIRPAGGAAGDQARVMTPADAIAAGADYLVVGRPITAAGDPLAAARAVIAEIDAA